MTDEIDRISEVVLNERQSVVKAWQTRTKEAPHSRGFCNDCGNIIPAQRLAALPDVVTCIDCQQMRERRRKTCPGK
ncbi:TraR/DksA C4-type zinc finger protein [Escherichia coli]|uniref:TraR/DksA C4-type zinc finger protein n=1 Tax=Escherichia coli TaxID=562 RepID=UPI000AE94C9A|nr:TraR/DksA C4-type zinc finger protein [Escherichia coli]EGM7790951.1 TraR/DksA family transcriptional regulator [Escherichia coli]EHX1937785.1 TraR/DksA C4-type zinc finger protein [Escherichia coli]MCO7873377.1 TraR/DksA C4-type zinc finger protein [Escherichia coli]MCO7970680.1 TraR/DksA C4-type zinc finger protein [Escherichia coli]MDS0726672.1 TraR/DksA C4-type zinc finger protein [Escherichia coli]